MMVATRSRSDGRRSDRLRGAMRQREPLGQLPRRFVRRLPVEGHHRRRYAGPSPQLSTPSVADGRDLNLVRAPANDFFKSMNDHVILSAKKVCSRDVILRSGRCHASEAAREGRAVRDRSGSTRTIAAKKYFAAAVLHRIFTFGAQVFHRSADKVDAVSAREAALRRRVQCLQRV